MAQAENRFEIPSIAFMRLISELSFLEDSKVTKVQELPNNWLKLRFLTKQGQRDLIFSETAFFVSEYSVNAKHQTSGFGAFLNKYLKMSRLNSVKQFGCERIVLFDFSSFQLIAELFSKGNLVLIDSSEKILMPKKAESWSSREIKKGLVYKAPPQALDLMNASFEEFAACIKDLPVASAVVKKCGIAPPIAEAACVYAGIDPKVKECEEKKLRLLFNKLQCFIFRAANPENEKAVLVEHKGKQLLLPFNENFPNTKIVQEFKSINSALNQLLLVPIVSNKSPVKSDTDSRVAKLLLSLENQKKALAECKKNSAEFHEKADALYLHFQDLNNAFEFAKKEFAEKKCKKSIMYNKQFGALVLREIDFSNGFVKVELLK